MPAELPTGQPLSEALALDDVVLGFNLTPNRGDCMSVLGIAREVAVLSGHALAPPAIAPVKASVGDHVSVTLAPDDIADGVAYMVTRPRHASVGELWIMPTDQA